LRAPLFWPTLLFFLLAVLVLTVGVVGERNLSTLSGGYAWVAHSRIVLDELASVRADVLHGESSSRGYRMTNDGAFLAEFDAARDRSRARIGRLRELVADQPLQATQVDSLDREVEEKILFHETMHRLARGEDLGARTTSAREGIVHMARVGRRLDGIREVELRLLGEREAATRQTYFLARLAGAALVVATLLLGILVFSLFARVIRAQRLEARAQEHRAAELTDAVTRATVELERRAGELERSNRDLEQFAFIASHDLQEPLRKIRTFADRIDSRHGAELNPEAADSLLRIRRAAGRMQQLVENLLEFSRVSRQDRPFEDVDLAGLFAEVEEEMSDVLEQGGGRLEIGWLPRVRGDRVQLRQLFVNLVANGLKFHRDGVPPVVSVRGEIVPPVDGSSPARALVTVSDNGIGFEPEYSERIFGLFQRLHGRDRYEGSGLGLAIARRIAEHHRGTMTAEGRPDQGAVLRVELPLPAMNESPS